MLDGGGRDRRAARDGQPVDVAPDALGEARLGAPAELGGGPLAGDVPDLDVGRPLRAVDDRHLRDELAHGVGDLADADILVADEVVDAAGRGRRESRDDAVGEVLDVDELPRLPPVAGDRQRLAALRLARRTRATTAAGRARGPYGMPKRRIVCATP